MDMFDFMVQSSGNLNLDIKKELPYRWCNGCVVDCGFEPRSGRTKYNCTIQLVFVASQLSTQH
jgi:hypothetical protein